MHSVTELDGDRDARKLACKEPIDEVSTRADVVCVAFGEVHLVDVENQPACSPDSRVTWRCEPGDVAGAVAKAREHPLCVDCFPRS